MVYESDFYTTRRPYSRPTVTSYSVTGGRHPRLHGIGKAQTFHHAIPFVAHKRLTVVSPPPHTVRVRPSVILAEIDRINHKVRPSLAYQPVEDYFNSRSVVSFDDETKSIRAQTAALLKRIHEPLPRATKAFPISSTRYQEPPIPERITSDAYIYRLLGPTHNVKHEIDTMSHYDEPAKRFMGKGHLACVSFAGGRAFPRRKNLSYDDDRVRNDVQYLSHYKKNIDAAQNHQQDYSAGAEWYRNAAAYIPAPRTKPISRFYRPTYISDENLMNYESPSSPTKKTSSTRSQSQPVIETPSSTPRAERQTSLREDDSEDRTNRRKKKRQEEERLAEEKALEEQTELEKQREAARQAELARQEKLAQEAAIERQKEIERKAELARKAELERQEAERKAEEERQAELARQEAERKAEEERQAELARQEAERKAEEERQAELARQEAERKAEEERQAELARQEAERKAEEERQAELARQEAERKAEEERQAELERQEAERKAEEERQEAERKAEEERQAELARQEELAKLEAETNKTDVTPEALAEDTAPGVEETEKPEAAPEGEEEVTATETVASPGVAEETGPEPVVEEPLSPDAQEKSTTDKIIEEVHDAGIPEEEEEEVE